VTQSILDALLAIHDAQLQLSKEIRAIQAVLTARLDQGTMGPGRISRPSSSSVIANDLQPLPPAGILPPVTSSSPPLSIVGGADICAVFPVGETIA
jgi:hypothetical protein